MKRVSVLLALLAVAAAWPTGSAHAASSGTATVTLAAQAQAMIQVLDPAVTLTPGATDYDNDYVLAEGASGLRVRVKTNSTTGLALRVRCSDASPAIALADLLVKTPTAPLGGGTSVTSYTAMAASDLTLWTTGAAQHPWYTVTTDIRIQNLINYDDVIPVGSTNYTNTLTYSVVAQ